jgi:pyruvate formate lyase activating enzyme
MQQYNIRKKSETDLVFNVQHYSLHDGSGIRTIVFLKGCPLRCRWCCNPESQKREREIFYQKDKCIQCEECGVCASVCPQSAISFSGEQGKADIAFSSCIHCLKCAKVCPSKAISVQGESYSVKQLVDLVERDSVFYKGGNGGLTVSGGEPLSHIDFLEALLQEAQRRYLDTAIETCGCAPYESLRRAAKHLNQILFDIKSMDSQKHKEYTGYGNEQILENFTRLCAEFPDLPKKVRTPVVPGFNDTEEDIRAIRQFAAGKPNVTYEPLKYHSFGKGKYTALGREYPMGDASLSEERFRAITE